ncbi:unnamed protein product [Eruca vesicaria subsp. sativa]|uniref:Uncharacterized protein n=1 Tax=Eruca vesicaria subsp. sativa TaxID=29727 RepID=A0ABC8LQE1_ERUVS|nr:unnamed protein product [Eruca vesicaria subsp. sativa]
MGEDKPMVEVDKAFLQRIAASDKKRNTSMVPPVTSKGSSIPLLGCIIDILVHLFTFSSTNFCDEQDKEFVDVAVEENRAAHKHFRQLKCAKLN